MMLAYVSKNRTWFDVQEQLCSGWDVSWEATIDVSVSTHTKLVLWPPESICMQDLQPHAANACILDKDDGRWRWD